MENFPSSNGHISSHFDNNICLFFSILWWSLTPSGQNIKILKIGFMMSSLMNSIESYVAKGHLDHGSARHHAEVACHISLSNNNYRPGSLSF